LESLEIHHKVDDIGAWEPANQLLNNIRSLKVFKLHTDCGTLMELASDLMLNNGKSLTSLELNIDHQADFNMDLLTAFFSMTDLSFTCKLYKFGFFPPTLKTLYWDAPLSLHWHIPEIRGLFPALTSLTLGPLAMNDLTLNFLCVVFFGTTDRKTQMKSITLLHKPVMVNDRILRAALWLPRGVYHVEFGDNIRITLK